MLCSMPTGCSKGFTTFTSASNGTDALPDIYGLGVVVLVNSTNGAAEPYELGQTTYSSYSWNSLYPAYVRGEAYLAAGQGREAAIEFQKILDHRGVVVNEPIGALAHLQIGRAYPMQGDTAKAKAAYQDFLTLWKEADPYIPVLIAAKAGYANLK